MMAGPSNDKCSCSEVCSDDPPPLSITLKKARDLPNETKHWSEVDRPVDILLLTVEDCELLACYHHLKDSFSSYEKSIGYVYFGKMSEDKDGSLKVALPRCSKQSLYPGGSQTTTKNAVTLLKPKATFLAGLCYSLNPEKAQLGDVVISSKLTTDFHKTPVSSYIGNLVRSAAYGWKAPLESPETREVNVCDGEILSCSDLIDAEQQCQSYPGAIAAEIEGKGLFAAAHEMKMEWLVVKGVCAFVHGVTSTNDSWKTFACVMAASVVSHMLRNSLVFEDWPHYRGDELDIKVAVDNMKLEEQNTQTGMLATESDRYQEVQQPRASAPSAASESVSCPQTDGLKACREEIFLSIVRNYLQTTPPQSSEEHNKFKEHLKEMRLIITGVSLGSLLITVKCESLMILEKLWTDYSSGHLGEVVQNCFVTEKILKELNLAELRLTTTMDIEEYNACKMLFEKDALRGALSSEFHSTSSTSESPPKNEQWGKWKQKIMEILWTIMERAKLGGTSPLIVVPTTGHGKELEEPWRRKVTKWLLKGARKYFQARGRKKREEDKKKREEERKRREEAFKRLEEEISRLEVPSEIYARGPEAVKAYNKALTGGKVSIKRIPVMLIGQERTGKTSLKKSLKGENFNEKEESTVGIDTDSLYFKVSKEIWKSGKVKEEVKFESEDIFEHLSAAKVISGFLREQRTNLAGFRPKSNSDSESVSESELEPPDGSSTKISCYGSTKPSRNIESLHGQLPEEVARLVEKMFQEEENANHEDNIYSVLWDFGGQSVYYETHPVFLTEKAIYILVSDLSRDPDENAIPPVKTGLFEDKVDIECSKTNLDYLDFWMSSIYSLVSPDVLSSQETAPNVVPRRLPPVFLVCTHADVPFGGSNPRGLASKTYGFLQHKTYKEHLYEDVFVVDNTKSGSEEECTEVKRLRKEILAVAKELQLTKEEIPVKWLRYESKLRKKHDKWITLEEAKRIAFEDCGIQEDDEFSTLLNFLHDQRIVIHFSGSLELERMVILHPQWLVDVLKNVITVRPFKHTEHPVKDLWIQLEETGILDKKLIDHAWRDLLNDQGSHESLIAIMERLSLISPWSSSKDSKQYLVPSMLMSPPTDDVLQLLDSVNAPSLFLTFASGRVPPGLFSRLILHFLQWCVEEWKSKVSPQLFHNFAMFHILPDQGISVIFWCHSSVIEVAVYSADNEEKIADISRVVRWELRFMLECMWKEFHWLNNVKYDMCVCCPVCSRPGSGKCRDHEVRGCECLHFLSESDLRKRRHCDRPGRSLLGDCRIRVKQFECWFLFGEEEEGAGLSTNQQLQAIHVTSHGGSLGVKGIFSIEGTKRKDLALPESIKTSIQSIPLNSGSDVRDIVIQFQEALQLEPASLANPEPETKSMIHVLALRAKSEKRDDLVRHLREITPAGTTGPLLNEDMPVGCMPHKQYKDLTFYLSGGDEWKVLAERLSFSQIEIRFLDKRVVNPSDVVLGAAGKHRYLSVGEIYDTLVDCGLPAIADLM